MTTLEYKLLLLHQATDELLSPDRAALEAKVRAGHAEHQQDPRDMDPCEMAAEVFDLIAYEAIICGDLGNHFPRDDTRRVLVRELLRRLLPAVQDLAVAVTQKRSTLASQEARRRRETAKVGKGAEQDLKRAQGRTGAQSGTLPEQVVDAASARQLRIALGLTQAEMSERLGYANSNSVSIIERGEQRMVAPVLRRYARVLRQAAKIR